MRLNILAEVPDDEKYDLSDPFDIEITLDYGEKVLHVNGKVAKDEQPQDVIMDIYNNLMKCPHCGEIIGNTADWTPNYCYECGKPLSGGNGKAQ